MRNRRLLTVVTGFLRASDPHLPHDRRPYVPVDCITSLGARSSPTARSTSISSRLYPSNHCHLCSFHSDVGDVSHFVLGEDRPRVTRIGTRS